MSIFDQARQTAQDAFQQTGQDTGNLLREAGGLGTIEDLAAALAQVSQAESEALHAYWQIMGINPIYEGIEESLVVAKDDAIARIQGYQQGALVDGLVVAESDEGALVAMPLYSKQNQTEAQILAKRDDVVGQITRARDAALKAIGDALSEALGAIQNAKETVRRLVGYLEAWERALDDLFN